MTTANRIGLIVVAGIVLGVPGRILLGQVLPQTWADGVLIFIWTAAVVFAATRSPRPEE